MTRAMLMTVLARFDGQDTTGGAVWYEKAMDWAKENGFRRLQPRRLHHP